MVLKRSDTDSVNASAELVCLSVNNVEASTLSTFKWQLNCRTGKQCLY